MIKSRDASCSLNTTCQNVRMSPVMEINQLGCFCRVGPYILNGGGGMLEAGWAPVKQQPVRFTHLEGNQTGECFWEIGGGWVLHRSFPAGRSRASCHTDMRPGGWWGDGWVMEVFFSQYELSGRLCPVRTHTLWCCWVFTGKASIWTPGIKDNKIKHDALLLDIHWYPVGLQQMIISTMNEWMNEWMNESSLWNVKKEGKLLISTSQTSKCHLEIAFFFFVPNPRTLHLRSKMTKMKSETCKCFTLDTKMTEKINSLIY